MRCVARLTSCRTNGVRIGRRVLTRCGGSPPFVLTPLAVTTSWFSLVRIVYVLPRKNSQHSLRPGASSRRRPTPRFDALVDLGRDVRGLLELAGLLGVRLGLA
jgi:hypothetical protein